MIEIEDKIVSTEIFDEFFTCDLNACKGQCCVEGDAGAPLEEYETKILEEIFPSVKPFLTEEGIRAVEEQGCFVMDEMDGEPVTPLVNGAHCAYTVFENGISLCGIEKAWKAGAVDFQKPISCHLYPIRTKKYTEMEAVNYDRWPICQSACTCGAKLKIPVYRFVKSALVRKYGEEWYAMLEEAVSLWENEKENSTAAQSALNVDNKTH